MRLIYFAWVREQIGRDQEIIDLPPGVETVADLLKWLAKRGGNYTLFNKPDMLRAAIDQAHVDHQTPIGRGKEIAIFPPMTGG